MIVAIDGPAGSGKGTIAKLLSKRYNLVNIDTGATYRCLALLAIRNNVLEDKEKIIELSKNLDVKFDLDNNTYLNGELVTDLIRTSEVTSVTSPISSIVEVRENLVNLQRKLASNYDVVMEGRDITTVVLPNADFKFYLDASLDERAKRRTLQINGNYDEIYESIKDRDYNDLNKKVGALKRTSEQYYIDSTNLSIEEVLEEFVKIIEVRK